MKERKDVYIEHCQDSIVHQTALYLPVEAHSH